jgi:DNA-binding winged helix-turn-helix (wHTH) protein
VKVQITDSEDIQRTFSLPKAVHSCLICTTLQLFAMPSQDANYRFGPFELRWRTRELYKNGTRIKLRPQPFQILHALVEHKGDVVTRDELRQILWPAETFVDFEHGLNTSMKELRGLLNDSATEPRFIETLPKLGYRMLVPVESDFHVPSFTPQKAANTESATPVRESSTSTWHLRALRRWAIPVAIIAVLISGLAAYFHWSRPPAGSQASSERAMLAVLPFENLTGDVTQDYFSDGLTEEMIGQLGRLDPQHLGVIASTSVMHYKHTQQPLPQVGRELGVQYVLVVCPVYKLTDQAPSFCPWAGWIRV